MKKATLFALIGVAVILLVRIYWFVMELSVLHLDYSFAVANLISYLAQIAGYSFIGYFLFALYKNQK